MKNIPNINTNGLTDLLIVSFDHKEPEDDDCGLPEYPISSNYSKYLWKSHSRNPKIRTMSRAQEITDEQHRNIK
jgi:hypothetical protein